MRTYSSFSPEQESVLKNVLGFRPLVWQQEITVSINAAQSMSELLQLRTSLQGDQQTLRNMLATLPPEQQIASFICDISMFPDSNRSYRVARVIDAGVNRNLDLPGTDIEAAIRAQYAVLDHMLALAHELLAMLNERIHGMHEDVVLPNEVLNAIDDIPLTTPEACESIREALRHRRGTILLREHPKKDAAVIVDHIARLYARYATGLTADERRAVTIECASETFPWFGPGSTGNRQRDQVAHVASQQTTKPSPRVAGWLSRHTL